jgi:hypothetical protein
MRDNQEFVWAQELKADLARMNTHYLALPESERERGVSAFAHLPPKTGDFLTARIYDRFGDHWRREPDDIKIQDRETEKVLVDELTAFSKSTEVIPAPDDSDDPSLNCHSLTRQVHKRKGSWWQLPKDLPERSPEHA